MWTGKIDKKSTIEDFGRREIINFPILTSRTRLLRKFFSLFGSLSDYEQLLYALAYCKSFSHKFYFFGITENDLCAFCICSTIFMWSCRTKNKHTQQLKELNRNKYSFNGKFTNFKLKFVFFSWFAFIFTSQLLHQRYTNTILRSDCQWSMDGYEKQSKSIFDLILIIGYAKQEKERDASARFEKRYILSDT